MANYRISATNKTVYLDLEHATEGEKEEAKLLAQANGFLLKITHKKPKKPATAVKEAKWLEDKLKKEGTAEELADFTKNSDKTLTHYDDKGRVKKNGYIFARSVVYDKHPEWREEYLKETAKKQDKKAK